MSGPGIHEVSVVAPDAVLEADVSIEATCVIESGARIGPGSRIGAGSYIGRNVRIGAGCVIHPGVVVLDNIVVGDRVVIHSGSVLGADGFGYVEDGGQHHKIPQIGLVEIEADVEIGACSCVDRATTGVTRVMAGTQIGNLVQIGHNVQIGREGVLKAQVGVAGSTCIGDRVVIEAQAGIGQHLQIGAGAHIGPRAGVIKEVPEGADYGGFPARPQEDTQRIEDALEQLPELIRRGKRRAELE